MSTSSAHRCEEGGFSFVELLVGLALILCISMAALALWRSVEATGGANGDRMVRLVQGRVAVARLERDVRLATAKACPFPVTGPVLRADKDQVVLLTRSNPTGELQLVEWEVVGENLMRRRGPCPPSLPASFVHTLYADNKTMLEGVTGESRLRYLAGGVEIYPPVPQSLLFEVDEVELVVRASVAGRSDACVDIVGGCLVGRR